MFRKQLTALVAVLALSAPSAWAVGIGDTPKVAFKSATDGQAFDLAAVKGKYVLVDFWATWCGPCMAQAEHMVELNDKYGPRGMVTVGVSLDRDLNAMKTVCKEKKFNWPQMFGPPANQLSSEWGVTGIPRAFLIDPAGKVLWSGHPAQIDKVLADAFAKNPPVLMDAKAFATATTALKGVEEHLTGKNPAAALKALAAVPPLAKEDTRTAAKVAELQKAVEEAAEALLAEVQPLIARKDYPAALGRLRDIAGSMKGTPTGDQARQTLDELSTKPEVKAQLAALDRAEKANVELAAAKKLQAAKQHEQAYGRLKVVATQFAGTPAATEAAAEAAKYEKDTAFIKRMNDSAASAKAKSALGLAQAYAKSGNATLATRKYQSVIDEFPGTSFAEQAKREMAGLK